MSETRFGMLGCGCAGQALHRGAHDGLSDPHPSCITHLGTPGACQPVGADDLAGRMARCAYFGRPPHNSECNFGGGKDKRCACIQPSSPDLPFFRRGASCIPPKTDEDEFYCGCHSWN